MPDKFVPDCSIAAKWVLPEPDRAPALGLFDQYASGEVRMAGYEQGVRCYHARS